MQRSNALVGRTFQNAKIPEGGEEPPCNFHLNIRRPPLSFVDQGPSNPRHGLVNSNIRIVCFRLLKKVFSDKTIEQRFSTGGDPIIKGPYDLDAGPYGL